MALDNLNLQPLLDLIGRAGAETSELKAAKSAGRVAFTLAVLGLIGFLAGSATNLFGAQSKIGIVAGAVAAIVGVVSQAAVSMGYSAARADTKQAAATALSAAAAAPAQAPLPVK